MEGADDIGLDEVFWAVNAAVDVRFSGKIDDGAGFVFGKKARYQRSIADVATYEDVTWVALQAGEILEIAGVGEFVEIDDGLIGLIQPVENEIAADKSGTACNQYAQNPPPSKKFPCNTLRHAIWQAGLRGGVHGSLPEKLLTPCTYLKVTCPL